MTDGHVTEMKAPSPFRIVILLERSDDEARCRAGELMNHLNRAWFEPELWRLGSDTEVAADRGPVGFVDALQPQPNGLVALMRLAWRLWSRRPALVYSLPSRTIDWGAILARLLGIAAVSDFRGGSPGWPNRIFRRLYARVIVSSPAQQDQMIARWKINPDRVYVLSDRRNAMASNADVEGNSGRVIFKDRAATELSMPGPIREIQLILLEVLQRNTSWTTTSDGRLPLELQLGAESTASAGPDRVEERGTSRPNRSVRFTTRSTMTVFLPDRDLANGTAVVICPGGGYAGVTIDKEGFDVARWLVKKGIAGIVLKYRLPRPDITGAATPWPMMDLDRALSLTRAHAAEWNISANRIGAMGFSAGGHMAASASVGVEPPAFAILVYPVISMERNITHPGSLRKLLGKDAPDSIIKRYSFEQRVHPKVPPTLLVHARDDNVAKFKNSIAYLEALRAANVPSELHILEYGGHGFGLGVRGGDAARWPDLCVEWIRKTVL